MKNKLLQCFRPVGLASESDHESSDCSDERNLNSTSSKIRVTKSGPLLGMESPKGSSKRRTTLPGKKNLIRSLSGSFKPAMFDISLKKNSRNKKPCQLTIESKSSDSNTTDAFSYTPNSESSMTNSSSSSSLTSCSSLNSSATPKTSTNSSASSPTSCFSSRISPTSKKLTQKNYSVQTVFVSVYERQPTNGKMTNYSGPNDGLFWLVTMSLGITLFCGRASAVIFTTLVLYLLSRSSKNNCEAAKSKSTVSTLVKAQISPRDSRKKVIMEGLLERNNLRRTH